MLFISTFLAVIALSHYCSMTSSLTPIEVCEGSFALNNEGTHMKNEAYFNTNLNAISFKSCNHLISIGWRAFANNRIASLVLPETVTNIEGGAFKDNRIAHLSLPPSLTKIGYQAFFNNKIVSLSIPSSVTSIGNRAFANNHIRSVHIPESLKSIEWSAFENNNIQSLRIPPSVTSIEDDAFANNNISILIISSSIINIGKRAFHNNPLSVVCYEGDSQSFSRSYSSYFGSNVHIEHCSAQISSAWSEAVGSLGSNSGHATISSILAHSESSEQSLPSHTLTKDIRSFKSNDLLSNNDFCINNNAENCSSSVNRRLHDEPVVICTNKSTSINCALGDIRIDPSLTMIVDNAFESVGIVNVDFTFANKLTTIGNSAFQNNQIHSLYIPSSVTSIERFAFDNNSITSLSIPSSLTAIKLQSFSNNKIASLVIPPTITEIESRAFSNNRITSLIVPASVQIIARHAFKGNPLTSACFEGDVQPSSDKAPSFFGIDIPFEKCENKIDKEKYT